eukprot:g13483.t1
MKVQQQSDHATTPQNLRNAVISACEQSSRWREAVRFFFAADCGEGKDQRRQDILDEVSLNTSVSSCASQKHWELSIQMLDLRRYLPSSIEPIGAAGFGAAVLGCTMAGAWVLAVALLSSATSLKGWGRHGRHLGGLAMALLAAVHSCEWYLQALSLRQVLKKLEARSTHRSIICALSGLRSATGCLGSSSSATGFGPSVSRRER